MSFHSWLQNLRSAPAPGRGQRQLRQRGSRRAATYRPNLEVLEDRRVPAFLAPVDYAVGAGPFEMKAGDFNGDGSADLATANAWSHTVSVLLSNGDGTFQPARDTPIGAGSFPGPGPFSLALGDFNEDGNLDIATANYHSSDSSITILLGAGDGTFVQGPTPFDFADRYTLGAGDLNGDGHLDLVATSVWDDFDTGATVTYVDVMFGDGDGTFVFDRWYGPYDGELRALKLADFDGDNKADVVADQYSAHGAYWGTIIFRGNGDGTLQEPSAFGTGLGSMADFNADGILDRAYFTSYMNQLALAVSLGNGDGSFAPPIPTPVASDLGSIALFAVADFNADGRPDVAVNFPYAGKVTVLFNDSVWDGSPTPLPPSLRIGDSSVTEGNTGTRAATFTVTLSVPSTETITIAYATADGSGTAGSDYQATSGTLTFAPGETSRTITVLVNGDRVGEVNGDPGANPWESFVVILSDPTNAVIDDASGRCDIYDDEPRLSIPPSVSRGEGNTGPTPFFFTVTLSFAYDAPVTVDWTTAAGSATAGSDYQAASGTLTIPAGQTAGTITVLVNGDRLFEEPERFFVNLSGATSSVITQGNSVGTIIDDEPRISISDVSKQEGKKNRTTLFTFTVTLSAAYDQPVTMSYRTVDGSATTSDSDYIAKTGTLTFTPGETTKTITIEVKGDSKRETNETFYLDLFGNSSNSQLTKSRGIGSILNDD